MRAVKKTLEAVVLLAVVVVAGIMIVPALLGYERYVITTGSMTGSYDAGSLVIDDPTPVSQLRVGDVITYVPPKGSDLAGRVTHRISEIGRDARGRLAIRTKGDANRVADSWRFVPRQAELPKVVASVPHIGHVYSRLSSPTGRLVVFAIPGLIIAISVLVGLWREAGQDVERRKLEEAAAA